MAPKFRIERLPSGVRYPPRRDIAHPAEEKGQSRRSPQVYVFKGSVSTSSLDNVDDSDTRSTQGPKQELWESAVPNSTYVAPNPDVSKAFAIAMHVVAPARREHNPQSPVDGSFWTPESGSDYPFTRSSRSTSRRPPPPPPPPPEPPIEEDSSDECLPLLKVNADVVVDGNISRTTLLQRFTNTAKEAIGEARYTFPLYDGAVVVGFKCTIGEDRELTGKVKAKDEARADYKRAVKMQETAALLEEHTPEIFETMIGNIPAETNVSVQLEYIQEIKTSIFEDGGEVLEVIIPMSIAPRYADSEGVLNHAGTKMETDGLDVTVKVIDSKRIQKLHCNHYANIQENVPLVSTEVPSFSDLGTAKEKSAEESLTQTIATFTSDSAIMDEDFIVSIEAHPSHPIRSRAILSPPNEDGLAALMLSIKPAEIFKSAAYAERFNGEVIFVLDRSGSMDYSTPYFQGKRKTTKISTLRKAMSLSIASLPKGCRFNIVSFGTDTEFLWGQSQHYTQANLEYARSYAKAIKADFGGTRLAFALKNAVDSRRAGEASAQIIVITDGEVEPDSVLEYVWETRQDLGEKIRFFALGIGHNVPHRLIDRIGEYGGGYGEVVDIGETPDWAGRLMRMLSAGIMPRTWKYEIELGEGFERRDLLSHPFGCRSHQQVPNRQNAVPFIQAPHPTAPLHPFTFRSTFLLFDLHSGEAPTHLVLRATADQTRIEMSHTLAVEQCTTGSSDIHYLAVKHALLDMETSIERQGLVRSREDFARQNAVRLGTRYHVSSRWTSFVAVGETMTNLYEIDFYKAGFIQGNFKDFTFPRNQSVSPSSTHDTGHLLTNCSISRDMSGTSSMKFQGSYSHSPTGWTKGNLPTAQACTRIMTGNTYYDRWGPASSAVRTPVPSNLIYNSASQPDPFIRPASSLFAGRPSYGGFGSDVDSDQSTSSEASHGNESHSIAGVNKGHVTLETLAESQNAIGLLNLQELPFKRLESHFHEHARKVIAQLLLSSFSQLQGVPVEKHLALVKTVMVIDYVRSHLALEEGLWEMIICKAEAAVLDAIGKSDASDLDEVESTLRLASMHEHLDEYMNESLAQEYCPFSLPGMNVCAFCEKPAPLDDSDDDQALKPQIRQCTEDGCDFAAEGRHAVGHLWEHMVNEGHLCH